MRFIHLSHGGQPSVGHYRDAEGPILCGLMKLRATVTGQPGGNTTVLVRIPGGAAEEAEVSA